MALAQQGDREAYGALMGELARAIEGFVRVRFGASGFVDDCVQESLLSIHRAYASYDPRRPFRPWLFAIVRRRIVDGLRAQSRRGVERETDSALVEVADPRHVDPGRRIDACRLLNALAPEYSEALIMTKLQGRSVAEAARSAGVSETAMKSRVHRAVRQVRRELERESASDLSRDLGGHEVGAAP